MTSQANLNDAYIRHGYTDRHNYLECLAHDYGICLAEVFIIADANGPSEDFDGLITMLEEYVNEEM